MPPDPFFWYGLVLKVAMRATIVVLVSVSAERSGAFIAALIAALPTAAGATYIILALEHPPAFIAAAAVGSMAANAAVAIFALTYAALAQRQGIVLSIAVASLLWFRYGGGLAIGRVDAGHRARAQCGRLRFHDPALGALPRRRGAKGQRQADALRPPAAGGGGCAGRRRGDDREPLDRLVCLRPVRSVSHRDGKFCGDHASAGGGKAAAAVLAHA